ncbi:MAG: serine/threonine-protein kinase [Gemmatimonadota bacterium]|nr:serine/threonine-protein kinase [Gemmatimonadota bacterium]
MTPAPGLQNGGRLELLFERAARLPEPARRELLERVRGEDPALADELMSLLRAGQNARTFFKSLGKTLFSGDDGVTDPRELIPQVDPLYGSFVGKYRIDTVLGRGGMGTVYRAVVPDPDGGPGAVRDQVWALKFLPAFAATSGEVRRRFIAEARVTSGVVHPNVSRIVEISETEDGRLYLVMPFYPGPTLRARIKTGPLPIDEARDWFRQTAAGLAAVHASGIIHRDLTPGNLIRDADGTVKILDFGLAKVSDVTLGTGNRPLGTITYMSPEQLSGIDIDARTDHWSLGVMLYEMLWGRRPFEGTTLAALTKQIRDPGGVEIPDPPEGVDPRLADLVRRLMSPAAKDRPRLEELDWV